MFIYICLFLILIELHHFQSFQDRRRSNGPMNSSNLSSGSTTPTGTGKQLSLKRSEEAPITHQGWLSKQGSDGLMLWKKRWFVLSEFCLFYYKGPDAEDKVLGSILLPSYKISPVDKNDNTGSRSKPYAFKAEHQNMRTYYFAAETKDSMLQWMNAMSLASILQHQPRQASEELIET